MIGVKKISFLLLTILSLPIVFAQSHYLPNFITNLGGILWGWMSNAYSVYFFTFIFFFILLYGIYSAALRKVKIFQEGESVNRQGKLVGISLSLLSCLSIFFFTRGKGIEAILEDVLAPFGIFAGFGIAMLVFGIVYFGFRGEDGSRSWKIALAAAGLGMIVAGMITTAPNIMWWGWLLAFIAGVGALIGAFSGGSTHREPGHSPGHSPEHEPEHEPEPEGQTTKIYGTVYGEKDGVFKTRKKLANVSINLEGDSFSTTTNTKGKYEFTIPSGFHQKLNARLEGYNEYQTWENIDGKKMKHDIILTPSSTESSPTTTQPTEEPTGETFEKGDPEGEEPKQKLGPEEAKKLKEVVELNQQGLRNADIAKQLVMSPSSVGYYLKRAGIEKNAPKKEKEGKIQGYVGDPNNKSISDAKVYALYGDGRTDPILTKEDGAFELNVPFTDNIIVWASHDDYQAPENHTKGGPKGEGAQGPISLNKDNPKTEVRITLDSKTGEGKEDKTKKERIEDYIKKYPSGSIVNIPRTDGRVTKAEINTLKMDNNEICFIVIWSEEKGEPPIKYPLNKLVSAKELDKLNPKGGVMEEPSIVKEKTEETPKGTEEQIPKSQDAFHAPLGSGILKYIKFKKELSAEEIEQSKSLAKRIDSDQEIRSTLKFIFKEQFGDKKGDEIFQNKHMMKALVENSDYMDISEDEAKLIKRLYKQVK